MTDAKFWNRIAPKYAKSKIGDPEGYEETLTRMQDLLEPHMAALEIGCGTGSTAIRLAPHVARFQGTDVASAMIEIADSKFTGTELPGLSFSTHAAGDIPDGPYDAVLALNLLHLLPTLEDDLKSIAAAMPKGGIFMSKTVLMAEAKWYLRMAIPVMQFFGKAPYLRSLDQAETLALIEAAGFEIEETLAQGGIVNRVFVVARKK